MNDFKNKTKSLTDKVNQQREENALQRRALDELDNNQEDDAGDVAKYELLVQRDKEMTAFMDKFEETRENLLNDQQKAKDMIVALLEHISRGVEDSEHAFQGRYERDGVHTRFQGEKPRDSTAHNGEPPSREEEAGEGSAATKGQ